MSIQEKTKTFICPVCGNVDIHSIGYLNGKPYCRRCIAFRRKEIEEQVMISKNNKESRMYLSYSLSEDQSEISRGLLENFKNKHTSFVSAICGSPKTRKT